MKHSSFEAPAKHLLPSFVFPQSVFAHTTLLISLSSSRSGSVPHLCLLFIAFALKNFVYLLFLQSTPPPGLFQSLISRLVLVTVPLCSL